MVGQSLSRGQLKRDGTRAETRFRVLSKRTSPFKSAGALVQSTAGSRGVRISGSNAGYTVFRGSVKSTGYPLLSPVSPSLPLPCVTVCHHISTGLYYGRATRQRDGRKNSNRSIPSKGITFISPSATPAAPQYSHTGTQPAYTQYVRQDRMLANRLNRVAILTFWRRNFTFKF